MKLPASKEICDHVAQAQLAQIALAMLAGNLSFIEGADQILAVNEGLGGVLVNDPDFRVFSVIQSETDHLPRQHQRKLWSPDVLAKLDSELQKSEAWARSIGIAACQNLYARFGP